MTDLPQQKRRVISGNAARVARYRDKGVRLDVTVNRDLGETVSSISQALDCSRNELLNSIIRFALTNRNWRVVGLYGGKKS